MMISEHFSDEEAITTETGLENVMPSTLHSNAVRLAETVLEPLRVLLGPLHVNSWYRSPAVNKAVKGEPNSYHMLGLAADIVPNGDVFKAFKMAVTQLHDLPIDKIIFEHRHSDWIHVQIAKDGEEPKHLAFTSDPDANDKMIYRRFDA